ncbi:hypothetical protein Lalb_Chr11g0070421 [Lupinus albus]|uniref:Uncharacterized protein n=1 Tax=Lupinus albus TaxID=3870 RepID=A0A6A4PSF3_LUPAL|nr:hypothetical protein Lalb_Chr11g0070421 [Lupinus albus]
MLTGISKRLMYMEKKPHEPLNRSSFKAHKRCFKTQSICAKYGRHVHYVSHADGRFLHNYKKKKIRKNNKITNDKYMDFFNICTYEVLNIEELSL